MAPLIPNLGTRCKLVENYFTSISLNTILTIKSCRSSPRQEVIWGGGMAPLIPNLGTVCKLVVKFASLYPQKAPRYLLHMKLGGLQPIFGCCERTEKSVAPTGIRTPYRLPCSLVTIVTELCRTNVHHTLTFSGFKALGYTWNYW
jgi:hypothetical protein